MSSFFFGGPTSRHSSVTKVTKSPNSSQPKSFQNLIIQVERTIKLQQRVRNARPKIDSHNEDVKPCMMRPRYIPTYERRKEIERMNQRLCDNMVKIQGRKNRYFNEIEGPPINHHTAIRLSAVKRITQENLKLYDELSNIKPRIVTQE